MGSVVYKMWLVRFEYASSTLDYESSQNSTDTLRYCPSAYLPAFFQHYVSTGLSPIADCTNPDTKLQKGLKGEMVACAKEQGFHKPVYADHWPLSKG